MKPTIVVGLHAYSMINPHWQSLRPMIATPDLDIMLNFHPRVNVGENSAGGHGVTKNFHILVGQYHENFGSHDIMHASIADEDLVLLKWNEKKTQTLLLCRAFDEMPELRDPTKFRQVKTYIKDALEYNNAGRNNRGLDYDKTKSSGDLDLIEKSNKESSEGTYSKFGGEVSRNAEFLQRFSDTEWLVLKPYNGARGDGHIKLRRERFYDYMVREELSKVENGEHIHFSPDWFKDARVMSQGSTYIKHRRTVEDENGSVQYPSHFNQRAPWLIQEYVDDIVSEYRFIAAGNKFWIRDREFNDNEGYRQANFDVDSNADNMEMMKYRRARNDIELDSRMVTFAKALMKVNNQRLYSIDFFVDSQGRLGVFEFGCHFGIDATDPNFVCDVWEAFIVNEVYLWYTSKMKALSQQVKICTSICEEDAELTEDQLRQSYEDAVKCSYRGSLEEYRKAIFEATGKKTDYEKATDKGFRGSFKLYKEVMKWALFSNYESARFAGYPGTETEWKQLESRANGLK